MTYLVTRQARNRRTECHATPIDSTQLTRQQDRYVGRYSYSTVRTVVRLLEVGVELVVVAEDLAAEGARQAHAAVLTRHVLLERVQASLQLRALGTLEQAVALHATHTSASASFLFVYRSM